MFNYNVYIGSENGLFKGVNTLKGEFVNMNLSKELNKNKEIVSICWKDQEAQDEMYYATKDHHIHHYKCTRENEPNEINNLGCFEVGDGVIRGFDVLNSTNFLTCVESGVVNVWSQDDKKSLKSFNVGNYINCMKKCNLNENLIATGGKENDLKIWDLESETNNPIFKAKNVADNWIQLREPVWVMSIDFYDNNKVAVGTGHHQVRVYDIKSGMRRPAVNIVYGECPITAIAVNPADTTQIIAGNTHGEMEMLDTRNLKPIKKYKGFAGTIKSMTINKETNTVATCGLDRFLRIHNIKDSTLTTKIYVKSRLNCLLYSKHEPAAAKFDKNKNIADTIEDDLVSDINSEDLGTDNLWSDLDSIAEEHPHVFNKNNNKKKRKNETNGGEDTFKKPR